VAAFQNISHMHLGQREAIPCDVLVCGDDPDARQDVIKLAALLGLRALDAGPARNARIVEGLTVLLIGINRRYKASATGIRITGLPETSNGQF
jgi:predicted dinucleotide-binding enzyme